MRFAFLRPRSSQDRAQVAPSARRRALSFALAIAAELILVLILLTLGGEPRPGRPDDRGNSPISIDLAPEQQATRQASAAPKTTPTKPQPPHPAPPRPRPAIILPTPERALPILILTKEEMAAADIAKLGTPAGSASASQGSSPGDSQRVGTGPNGEPLYAAEWYREPTDRELSGYLPAKMPESGGWGMVACRTAARYHVEDCVELGNGPAGSHLAGAVRQAAWQFLVRPPRVGGRELVGTWVRIRIDYTQSPAD
ncbi:hypothetical protein [Sphingomonas sp.]|uniref:hypothetical protein n=1 Tax=Sphingomonas sp. TaxID=28214 RepID=UPI00325FD760